MHAADARISADIRTMSAHTSTLLQRLGVCKRLGGDMRACTMDRRHARYSRWSPPGQPGMTVAAQILLAVLKGERR
jgi:hypothetical protein